MTALAAAVAAVTVLGTATVVALDQMEKRHTAFANVTGEEE